MSESSAGIAAPLDAQVRLLLPFRLERRDADAACRALLAASPLGKNGAWRRETPKHFYRDEVSPQAEALIAPGEEAETAPLDGRYLRVETSAALRWFQKTVLLVSASQELVISLEPSTGIELFLSGHGVGVLSFTLVFPSRTPVSNLLDAMHRLSQGRRHLQRLVWLRTHHPRDDAERWARIPEAERARLDSEPPLAEGAPLAERAGSRGGRFNLIELADELLAPLRASGLTGLEATFVAYSCWRFDEAADFADKRIRERHLALASAIAQVEESSHASGAGIDETAETATLNSRHIAAVCAQGAAHLVADQPGVAFNEERLLRVRDKYFVAFLAALVARTIARRLASDAATAVHRAPLEGPSGIDELRRAVLDFSLSAVPLETSTRAVINRFYRMCENAMEARRELERVDRALASFDIFFTAKRQERLTARVAESAEASRAMQVNVEWIEIFLVFVYSAELAHLLFSVRRTGAHAFEELLVVGGFAMLSAIITAIVLRPWKHRRS